MAELFFSRVLTEFRELFVMPESIFSIRRHFIGNSTNANGTKGCACPAGKGELKVCMSFEPHFISSPARQQFFPPFWPFVSHCEPPRCETLCQAVGQKRKRRKLFALSGLETRLLLLSHFNALPLPFWGRFVLLSPQKVMCFTTSAEKFSAESVCSSTIFECVCVMS